MSSYGCEEHQALSRRQFLGGAMGAGAGTFLGLFRPEFLYASSGPLATADSVILLWMSGGQSHLDTWDPKPGTENGGPTRAILTAAKGIKISHHLPRIAKSMRDISLIRSLTSSEGSHERATYLMHTGYVPAGGVQHSTLGSVAWKAKGKINPELPAYVSVGGKTWPAGFLGSSYAPFQVRDPDDATRNSKPHRRVDAKHFQSRLKLLRGFDEKFATDRRGEAVIKAYADHYEAAYAMMKSRSVAAFDLKKEPAAIRQRYGDTFFGQGCLLARRLVQVGVRFIEVTLGGWDMHQGLFDSIGDRCNTVDRAFSALLWDLDRVDKLDRTLIVLCSEFGRTPKINKDTGRDHWPRVWSAALAGGGIVGGRVVGKSTAGGEEVAEDPIRVNKLHATICKCLGIDWTVANYTPEGRLIRIVEGKSASPIAGLF